MRACWPAVFGCSIRIIAVVMGPCCKCSARSQLISRISVRSRLPLRSWRRVAMMPPPHMHEPDMVWQNILPLPRLLPQNNLGQSVIYCFLQWLARRLGVPLPTDGGDDHYRLRFSRRFSNAGMLASGFRLQYPDYRSGYGAMLQMQCPVSADFQDFSAITASTSIMVPSGNDATHAHARARSQLILGISVRSRLPLRSWHRVAMMPPPHMHEPDMVWQNILPLPRLLPQNNLGQSVIY